jgi:hypothetical protein
LFIKIAYPNANQQAIDELKFPSQLYSPVKVASLLPKDELQKFCILFGLQEQYGMKWRDKIQLFGISWTF